MQVAADRKQKNLPKNVYVVLHLHAPNVKKYTYPFVIQATTTTSLKHAWKVTVCKSNIDLSLKGGKISSY